MKAVFFALYMFCFLVAINAGITFKEVLDSALGFRNAKGIVDGGGKICFDKAKLIAYSHGEYFALGKKLGKFGYSTDKKNKARVSTRALGVSKPRKKTASKRRREGK